MARAMTKTTVKKEAVAPAIGTKLASSDKKFDKEDMILCRSITVGGLYLDGVKTKNPYHWVDYGDTEYVEYQDLVPMVRAKKNVYIYGSLIVIEDEDFIDEFPELRKFYDDQYSIKELESVLSLPVRDMVATIESLPNGAKNSLKNIASTQVVNGTLDSVKKIKALDELFGTELNLLSSLVSEQ